MLPALGVVSLGLVGLGAGIAIRSRRAARPAASRIDLSANQGGRQARPGGDGRAPQENRRGLEPGADRREYVVGVELLVEQRAEHTARRQFDCCRREAAPPNPSRKKSRKRGRNRPKQSRPRGPLAIVTSYRYFDDITVFSTVDLATNRVVRVEAAQHLRTPLSQTEFERPRRWPAKKARR